MLDGNKPEFLFCGRSNVGKSSFINGLCNRKNLARTSSKPGKTITLNMFEINEKLIFVDVPGYGYAIRSKAQIEQFGRMIEEYIKTRQELKLAFLLVDIRHAPTDDDKTMFEFLKYYGIKTVIIATKYDKITRNQLPKQIKLIKETLELTDELLIPVSSETRFNLDKVEEIFDSYVK
jgi:GTP-binding protein